MNSPRFPARRAFLRLLGALVAVPTTLKASAPTFASDEERKRWLREWGDAPRIPVDQSGGDPVTAALLTHAAKGRPLPLFYHGGSQPGCLRRFSPELVFRHEGGRPTYVSGFCHLRQAPRILRVDRVGLA